MTQEIYFESEQNTNTPYRLHHDIQDEMRADMLTKPITGSKIITKVL